MKKLAMALLVLGLAAGLVFVGAEVWTIVLLAQNAAPAPLGGA